MISSILIPLRNLVFGLSVACNAIIASVAVWNLSIAQSVDSDRASVQSIPSGIHTSSLTGAVPVDAFLIFVGAFGLTLVFGIVFVTLGLQNPFTNRVWFELCWVGTLFIIEMVGASTASAIVYPTTCLNQPDEDLLDAPGACTSSRVLIAFTWICTLVLLSYFIMLLISALLQRRSDPDIWYCRLQHFPPLQALRNDPQTPTLSRTVEGKTLSIQAPRPRRPAPSRDLFYSYRSGLGPEYEIEHYQPDPDAPPSNPSRSVTFSNAFPREVPGPHTASSFYPQYMQSSIPRPPPSQPMPSEPQSSAPPSPPPLGAWPRADIMSQATRPKRKAVPSSSLPTMTEFPQSFGTSPPISPSMRPPRPAGPRKRTLSGEHHRPSLGGVPRRSEDEGS